MTVDTATIPEIGLAEYYGLLGDPRWIRYHEFIRPNEAEAYARRRRRNGAAAIAARIPAGLYAVWSE